MSGQTPSSRGLPIHFDNVTGERHSFLERPVFPYLTYTNPPSSLAGGERAMGFIFTMNAPEQVTGAIRHPHRFAANEKLTGRMFGQPAETPRIFKTLQFEDCSKVVFRYVDPEERKERRRTVFPLDCQKAFALGARLAAPR